MRKILFSFSLILMLSACGDNAEEARNEIVVKDAYSFETPTTFPAAAVFMTIQNGTNTEDRLVDFTTDHATRSELHTMVMRNNIMQMRRVDDYTIAAGETHTLKPGGDHIMIFNTQENLSAGDSFDAVVLFNNAGEVPVTVTIRPREEMNMEN